MGLWNDRHLRRGNPILGSILLILVVMLVASSALASVKTGKYTGNGALIRSISGLGFQPAVVIVKGDLAESGVIRVDFYGSGDSKQISSPAAHITGGIRDFDPDGFEIGNHAGVNAPDIKYSWVALSADPGELKTGFYTGNGGVDRWVNGVGFQPEVVMVLPNQDHPCQFRTIDMPDDYSTSFEGVSLYTNHIEYFLSDQFRVGSDPSVNEWGESFGYVAFNANAAKMVTGSYTGDGLDNHTIDAIGFGPEFVIVKSAEPEAAVGRPKSLGDPWSTYYTNELNLDDGIMKLGGNNFKIGINQAVNEPDKTFYYVAFNDVNRSADLVVGLVVDDTTPDEGQEIVFDVTLFNNNGPDDASLVTVDLDIPTGLTYTGDTPSAGTFDSDTGVWTVGSLDKNDTVTLRVTATADASTGGSTLTTTAWVSGMDESDPDGSNNSASTDVTVNVPLTADLGVTMAVNDSTLEEGQEVKYAFNLSNYGPDDATGAAVTITFPAGLTYISDLPGLSEIDISSGIYDSGTGLWTVGSLTAGQRARLGITLSVDPGTAGSIQTTTAEITAADQMDPVAANNSTSLDVEVLGSDLAVAIAVDDPASAEGEQVVYTVDLDNIGPSDATSTAVTITLPTGLTYDSDTPGTGSFDSGSGIWTVGPVDSAETAQLLLTASVDPGTAGSTLTTTAAVSASDQADPVAANNSAAVDLEIHLSANLGLTATFDNLHPRPGESSKLSVILNNAGPNSASDIQVDLTLSPELLEGPVDMGGGTWDGDANTWTLPQLNPFSSDTLFIRLLVDGAAGGTELTAMAAVTAVNEQDPDPGDNSDTATLVVEGLGDIRLVAQPFDESQRTLLPGADPRRVLLLDLINDSTQGETLTAITMTNPITGPYDQATQDGAWEGLWLQRIIGEAHVWESRAAAHFVDGRLTFSGLNIAVGGGATVQLVVRGSAALTAPDGLVLEPGIQVEDDLVFGRDVTLQGTWPLVSPGTLTVDGMTAAQINLNPVGAEIFQIGSVRNLALDVILPPDGALPDQLNKLNVINLGTAEYPEAITRMESWADDGDGQFNPALDTPIADLHWTGGQRYEASTLNQTVPVTGLRIFITVDIAEDALGGTVRLSLPDGDDQGVGMASGNDGPIDMPVSNSLAQTVSATNRVIVTTASLTDRAVAPGEDRVPVIHLVARNLYADQRTVRQLRLSNITLGDPSAGQGELDGTVDQLVIQRDGDLDGELDGPEIDPIIASTSWESGSATFDGLAWELAPDQVIHLFITANVALHGAADGDLLGAVIGTAGDIQFTEATALVGDWPLDSGARYQVDGMVAAQVDCPAVPPVSLTANEGPVVTLDLTVPGNGYLADTLQTLRLSNIGTAIPQDISELGLYDDQNGNGIFEPGIDPQLATFTGIGQNWVALDVALSIPAAGRRLFVGLTVASAPTDSATVRLAVPVNGFDMVSANDGPRDLEVISPTTLLMSTAPLLSNISFDLDRSTTEMTVAVTMHVNNVGGEDVVNITPRDLALTGDGAMTLVSGPEPAVLHLDHGIQGTFTWLFAGQSQGPVVATGRCEGIGDVGGQPRGSLASGSAAHLVLDPALDLDLYPVANMPFSINRGQTGVVPMTLTLLNGAGPHHANLRLEQLVITLDDGDGNPVIPTDLLSHITVNEGANVFCDITDLESSGQTMTLPLDPAVVITDSEPVTLGLRLDIRSDTPVSRFRVIIMDATDLTVVDNVSDLPRTVNLSTGTFPVMSASGSIVSQATGLVVSSPVQPDLTAGTGQEDVPLLQLELTASGEDDASEVKVGSFAVMVVDTLGNPLPDASAYLSRLWVEGPLGTNAAYDLSGPADSLVVFELLPQVTVPVGSAAMGITIHGRLEEDSMLGPLRIRLEPTSEFDARDGNNSADVLVVYQPTQITGPRITIQETPLALEVAVIGELPPVISLGARDVLAMTIPLTHQGPANSAAIRLDTLRLDCLDINRQSQDPDVILNGYSVLWNGEDLNVPVFYQNQQIVVPLGGRLLTPFAQGELAVWLDVEADAPAGGFELVVSQTGIVARDHNLDTHLPLMTAPGHTLPSGSNLARLQPPSEDVVVRWVDQLPPLIPTGDVRVEAIQLILTNPASPGAAPAELTSLVLRALDRNGQPLLAGAILSGVTVEFEDSVWVDLSDPQVEDSTLVLAGTDPLSLAAGVTSTVLIKVSGRSGVATDGLSLGFFDGDVVCAQPGSSTPITVSPAPGQTFPFWTAAASMVQEDLAQSYFNFPNPFAAGREQTSFAFNLIEPATVSLRIWTSRGEPVITLLTDEPLVADSYYDFTWNGRNGKGQPVHNGVYLAELKVRYQGGDSEQLYRKVAVVR